MEVWHHTEIDYLSIIFKWIKWSIHCSVSQINYVFDAEAHWRVKLFYTWTCDTMTVTENRYHDNGRKCMSFVREVKCHKIDKIVGVDQGTIQKCWKIVQSLIFEKRHKHQEELTSNIIFSKKYKNRDFVLPWVRNWKLGCGGISVKSRASNFRWFSIIERGCLKRLSCGHKGYAKL